VEAVRGLDGNEALGIVAVSEDGRRQEVTLADGITAKA
jgi:hypothetical protein